MTKKEELAKNTLIIAIGKICTQFVNFLLLPLYTTLLLPEEYGIVDLFNTYITLLVPIFNWQFETGLFRFMLDCRKDLERQKKLFSTVFFVNIMQCLIYIVVFLIAQNFISSEYKIFLAIDVVLNIILNTMLQFPRGLGDNKTYSMGSFISASSIVTLNVIFIALLNMRAYGMFIATVIGKLVTIIYLIIKTKTWKYLSIKLYNKQTFKDVFKYSIPLVPNQLSWWVVGVSDRTIIAKFISIAQNGIYSIANKFSAVYITFYNIFNLSWTESVSIHLSENDSNSFFTETINSIFCLFSSLCYIIIAFMPFVFPILVGSDYRSAYFQIPILMIAVLFQVIVGLYSAFYVALKKSKEIAKTSIYAALINIIVDLLLIKYIGLYAASISSLVAFLTMGIFRYFDVKKYVEAPISKKNILLSMFVGLISIVSYYYNHLAINILSVSIVLLYSILLNRSFIMVIFKTIRMKVFKIK